MGRKSKLAKGRLDKFYHIAKEQGYRSRASFKLIQLNKKYQFLQNANVVVDLCAAPGGWLQVVEKFTPHNSIKIGIDLDHIKPIPGVKTFQEDITTPSCYQKLKNELRNAKADVVMNDGAPNVGSNWNKDAYVQIDLCLSALKLACNFLRKGGVFITKVFRSNDYNALIWVMNKFFGKVEANKPLASRFTSAEIFVVCQDFLAPDVVDEKLFDSKYIFKDTEADAFKTQMESEINSVDKIMEKRRKRQGYDSDMPMSMHKTISLKQFIEATNPYVCFVDSNAVKITKEDEDLYLSLVPIPEFGEDYLKDLQVLGKREILIILKWRGKIIHAIKKREIKEKKEREKSKLDFEKEMEKQAKEADSDNSDNSELELEYRDALKKELKQQRKDREKKLQTVGKKTHGMEFGGEDRDEELFDLSKHKKLRNMAYVEVEDDQLKIKDDNKLSYRNNKELEDNLDLVYEQQQFKKQKRQAKVEIRESKIQAKINLNKLRCGEIDQEEYDRLQEEQAERLQMLEEDGNEAIQSSKWFDKGLFKDIKELEGDKSAPTTETILKFNNPLKPGGASTSAKDGAKGGKNKPSSYKIDEDADSSDMYDESEQNEEDDEDFEDDEDLQDEDGHGFNLEREEQKFNQKLFGGKQNKPKKQYQEEDENLSDDDMYVPEDLTLKSQKGKKKTYITQDEYIDPDEKVPGELSDDDAYKLKVPKSEMELRRERLKKQREKNGGKKEIEKKIKSDGFEVVPQVRMEDYNIDELAETLAIAKKMLRTKNRERIIDQSYSRHNAFGEDEENLPKWFVEDERAHRYKIDPISKAEFDQEKEKLKAINAKAPKKILEAKIRNYKRLQKKLQKAKQKANTIMEQEGLTEGVKIKQIKTLYKKETADAKQKKRVVVGRKTASGPVKQGSRKVKYVDKRLLKDNRGEKAKQKRGPNEIGKKKISKKRQVKRHK